MYYIILFRFILTEIKTHSFEQQNKNLEQKDFSKCSCMLNDEDIIRQTANVIRRYLSAINRSEFMPDVISFP